MGCDCFSIAALLCENVTARWRKTPSTPAQFVCLLLGIAAGSLREPALSPQFFPIPHPGCHLSRQAEPELMRKHTHLSTMVGLVRNHVAKHFDSNRPRRTPAVSAKLRDAAPNSAAERFSQHLRAAGRALGQSRTRLLRRAMSAVELWWDLQVRSSKPDPLAADIVHVGKDRRNTAGVARRFGSPGGRVEMFDEDLVDAIVGGKDLDCGLAELSVHLGVDGWSRLPAPRPMITSRRRAHRPKVARIFVTFRINTLRANCIQLCEGKALRLASPEVCAFRRPCKCELFEGL